MATLKFVDGSLQLLNDDDVLILDQDKKPGTIDVEQAPWSDRAEALAFWESTLKNKYGGLVDLDTLVIEE